MLLEGSWNVGAEQELCSQTAQGLCSAIPYQTSNHGMPSLHSFHARLVEGELLLWKVLEPESAGD